MRARPQASSGVAENGDEEPPSRCEPAHVRRGVDGLLIGKRLRPTAGFGFANSNPPPATDHDELILYEGDAHLLTVASTGSGKGRGLIIPNLLMVDRPVIVIDPKGENYAVTARARRQMGHRVIKLDPFQLIDDDYPTDSLNPLDLFQLPRIDLESEAQMLANMMSLQNRGVKDPFWDEHGCGLLSGVIAAILATKPPEDRNLDSVFNLLMGDDCVYNTAVILDTQAKSLPLMAQRELASFLQLPERDTRGSVLATTNSYLKPFLSAPVLQTLRQSSFDLQDIVAGQPVDVFVMLPSDKLGSHRGLLRLWIGTLLKAITSRRRIPEKRTLFIIDECAQLEEFAFLEKIITLCRGYGLQAWTFWQDLAQLRTYYPRSHETIINNCEVVQAFGVRNHTSANQVAPLFNSTAAEMMKLPANMQSVILPQEGVTRAGLFDYLKDDLFQGLWDRNRYFDRGEADPLSHPPQCG